MEEHQKAKYLPQIDIMEASKDLEGRHEDLYKDDHGCPDGFMCCYLNYDHRPQPQNPRTRIMMASRCYKAVDAKSTSITFECPPPPPVESGGSQCSGWELLKFDDATKDWIEDFDSMKEFYDRGWKDMDNMFKSYDRKYKDHRGHS